MNRYAFLLGALLLGCRVVTTDFSVVEAPLADTDGGVPEVAIYDVAHGGTADFAFEATATSVVLQSRLHVQSWTGHGPSREGRNDGDLPGAHGFVRFEVEGAGRTEAVEVAAEDDGIARRLVSGLLPDTLYRWRTLWGPSEHTAFVGSWRTFRTLPDAAWAGDAVAGPNGSRDLAFVSCPGHEHFLGGSGRVGGSNSTIRDRFSAQGELGLPAWRQIEWAGTDYLFHLGDLVYYDGPGHVADTTLEKMRQRWHRAHGEPWLISLLGNVSLYAQKDDHDWRFDDADPTDVAAPSATLGTAVWNEQAYTPDVPYRRVRFGQLAEFFFVEVRESRSNIEPATLLGADQLAWLEASILESDAAWRVIVSPTPWVGPDLASKTDNYCSSRYRAERDSFITWAQGHALLNNGAQAGPVFVITGDRHWAYRSIDPSGLEEFSTGATSLENSQLGYFPGDTTSTDPGALVAQPFHPTTPTASWLQVRLFRVVSNGKNHSVFQITSRGADGTVLYQPPSRKRVLPGQ